MSNSICDHYQKSARLLRVISHPVRLAILDVLNEADEVCVCHLEALLGYRQAYLSQHLMRLREIGLVHDRRAGRNIYYHISEKGVAPIIRETKKCTFTSKINFRADGCECPDCESEPKSKNDMQERKSK